MHPKLNKNVYFSNATSFFVQNYFFLFKISQYSTQCKKIIFILAKKLNLVRSSIVEMGCLQNIFVKENKLLLQT